MNNFLEIRENFAFPYDFLLLFCDKKQILVNSKQHCDNFLEVDYPFAFSFHFRTPFRNPKERQNCEECPVANIQGADDKLGQTPRTHLKQ